MAKFLSFRSPSVWQSLFVALLGGVLIGATVNFAEAAGIPGASDFGNYFGFWILFVTLIAVWSHSWQQAALHAVIFLLAMLATYYLCTLLLLGYFLAHLLRAWAVVTIVFAPPFAIFAWHGTKRGWWAALAAALPIGLLLAEAYRLRLVFPLHGVQLMFNIIASLVLLLIVPRDQLQRLRAVAFLPLIVVGAQIINAYLIPMVIGVRL